MIAFQTLKQIALNFCHRKALVAHSFPSVIWLLVYFTGKLIFEDTSQVILVLMTPVLSFYDLRGLRKRADTHRRNKDDIYRLLMIRALLFT